MVADMRILVTTTSFQPTLMTTFPIPIASDVRVSLPS